MKQPVEKFILKPGFTWWTITENTRARLWVNYNRDGHYVLATTATTAERGLHRGKPIPRCWVIV